MSSTSDDSGGASSHVHDTRTPSDGLDLDFISSESRSEEEKEESESSPASEARPGSAASKPRSMRFGRARSHNGYGCDEDVEEAVEATETNPFIVRWKRGDADPLNPRSLSLVRKWSIVIICSLSSLCVTCTSSIYASTYEQTVPEFHSSQIVATLGLSFFILGLGFGPMLLAPLSEFYGRRPIYLVSFAFFVIWIIPSAAAHNMPTMLVARFLDGFSGSAFLSVSGGSVGDLFSRNQLQAPMMVFTSAPFIGPTVGPLVGGFINQHTSWRWTYYVVIIWSFVMWVLLLLFVPETYHPVLLRNKARKIRAETGDERYKAPLEMSSKSIPRTILLSLYRPFQLLMLEFMVLSLCIFSAILLGILYLFFGAFPLVFGHNHDFTLSQVGLSFIGIFVGMMVAMSTDPLWAWNYRRLVRNSEEKGGSAEPEHRLPPAIAGAVLVPIGIFMFGWTTYRSVHWIVPIIGSSIFGTGTLLVFTGVFTFLVDAYPEYAASALAANSFVRSCFAAAFPLFGVQMYNALGYQWASSLLAFLTVAMMPFPYIFFRYGHRIRRRSRFASGN